MADVFGRYSSAQRDETSVRLTSGAGDNEGEGSPGEADYVEREYMGHPIYPSRRGLFWIRLSHWVYLIGTLGQIIAYPIVAWQENTLYQQITVQIVNAPVWPRAAPAPLTINDSWNLFIGFFPLSILIIGFIHHMIVLFAWSYGPKMWMRDGAGWMHWMECAISFGLSNIVYTIFMNGSDQILHVSVFALTYMQMHVMGATDFGLSRYMGKDDNFEMRKSAARGMVLFGTFTILGFLWGIMIQAYWIAPFEATFAPTRYALAFFIAFQGLLFIVHLWYAAGYSLPFSVYHCLCLFCSFASKTALTWLVYLAFLNH